MKNLNLKSKLILLMLFPIVGLLFLSITISYDRYNIYTKLDQLNKAVVLSKKTKSLIYSLQKERGFSNGYLGSSGKYFKPELTKQWNKTTKQKNEFNEYLKTIDTSYYGNYFKNKIDEAITELAKIEKLRDETIKLTNNERDINSFYTELIDIFLKTTAFISSFSNDIYISQQLYAHTNLIYGIEKTANERGLGTLAFSSEEFPMYIKYQFNSLISEQKNYFENFEQSVNKDSLEQYKNVFKGKIVEESIRMRDNLLNSITNKNFFIDNPSYWFNTMTNKISLLEEIDNHLLTKIQEHTKLQSNNAKRDMNFYIFLCLVIIIAVLFTGRKIGINIVNSVNGLLDGIDRFFKFVNKESNYIEPIEIKYNDEIGRISKMINEKILISKKIIDEDIIERAKQLEIEVKKKTHDLKIKNQEYKILLDRFNTHVIATRTDPKGIITFATDKFCKDSGYTKEELIGKNHNIVRHPDMPKSLYQKMWDTLLRGENYLGELKNRRKDGSEYWLRLIIVPEFDSENNIIGYFSVKENIDDKIKIREFNSQLEEKIEKAIVESRKKDELLSYQSKLATMGEMIGIIAHQWKQPLSSLSMTVQSIKYKKDLNPKYLNTYVTNNMELISFMSKTIDDFRNFFRQDKIKEDFSILICIEKTLNILNPQLNEENVNINIEGKDFYTNGLQSEFQQVIVNIISNAKDALIENNEKNRNIDIETKIEENMGVLLIRDNAGGIPTEILNKVFEPYFTTKGANKGTGIGLYISKTIIEDTMKGKLLVENTQQGALFKITLPLS